MPCIGDFGPKTGEIDWVATFGRFVKFNLYELQPYEHRDKIDFALALNSRLAGILEGTKEHADKMKGQVTKKAAKKKRAQKHQHTKKKGVQGSKMCVSKKHTHFVITTTFD